MYIIINHSVKSIKTLQIHGKKSNFNVVAIVSFAWEYLLSGNIPTDLVSCILLKSAIYFSSILVKISFECRLANTLCNIQMTFNLEWLKAK